MTVLWRTMHCRQITFWMKCVKVICCKGQNPSAWHIWDNSAALTIFCYQAVLSITQLQMFLAKIRNKYNTTTFFFFYLEPENYQMFSWFMACLKICEPVSIVLMVGMSYWHTQKKLTYLQKKLNVKVHFNFLQKPVFVMFSTFLVVQAAAYGVLAL